MALPNDYLDPKLPEAIRIWAGVGVTSFPSRDGARVIARYGDADGARLLSAIRRLEDDFYAPIADVVTGSGAELADKAKAEFLKLHPLVTRSVVDALYWCYSYDYR